MSITAHQDRLILQNFYQMADGVPYQMRQEVWAVWAQLYQQRYSSNPGLHTDRKIIRRGDRLLYQYRNQPETLVLDFSSIQPGQSLAFANTFALADTFAFALALGTFALAAFAFTFALGAFALGAFALAECFEPVGSGWSIISTENPHTWDSLQQNRPNLQGGEGGFWYGEGADLELAGHIQRDGTVSLSLPKLSPDQAAEIFAMLRRDETR